MFDYAHIDQEEWPWAQRLAQWCEWQWPQSRWLDIGAGPGTYVRALREQGLEAQGLDPGAHGAPDSLVWHQDLRDPPRGEWSHVLCLEVFEHILPEHTQEAFRAMTRWLQPGAWVIFSAARPGQGGVGHINCRPWQEWQDLARPWHLRYQPCATWHCIQWARAGAHMGWFTQNCQIWRFDQ